MAALPDGRDLWGDFHSVRVSVLLFFSFSLDNLQRQRREGKQEGKCGVRALGAWDVSKEQKRNSLNGYVTFWIQAQLHLCTPLTSSQLNSAQPCLPKKNFYLFLNSCQSLNHVWKFFLRSNLNPFCCSIRLSTL